MKRLKMKAGGALAALGALLLLPPAVTPAAAGDAVPLPSGCSPAAAPTTKSADVRDLIPAEFDSRTVAPDWCDMKDSSADLYGLYWGGKLDHCASGYCKKVSGVYVQPSFSTCTGGRHAIWTGLGDVGNGGGGLIQAGTDRDDTTGALFGWWEMINSDGSNPYQYQHAFTSWAVAANDHVQATTWFDTSNNWIHFNLLNVTTGANVSLAFSSVNGEPTTDFWNGTQAEYIDERTQHTDGSGPFPFSRPSNAVTHWLSDYTNGIAASNATFVPENWIVTRDGTQFGVAIESPQAFGTNASFDNLWYHCS